MKIAIRLMTIAVGLFAAQAAVAQAPAGATGQCKDGTYTTSASKSGACRGHQGVKEWFGETSGAKSATEAAGTTAKSTTKKAAKSTENAVSSSAATAATAPAAAANAAAPAASTAAAAPAKAASKAATAAKEQAPGGGPGMVWLNTDSNVYHCPGSSYYGKTKQGAYMTEADAKAKGAHADHNRPCK
ncbi:MAG TPA: DUF3761 domain-containing protein [Edaphobacter sp.]